MCLTTALEKMSKLEGKFHFVHSRIKSCAESIAFFGGEEREQAIVRQRFEDVMALDWERNWLNFKYRYIAANCSALL
jgi:ABC-type uncharacterized transport system fused permease/ATPase subunit